MTQHLDPLSLTIQPRLDELARVERKRLSIVPAVGRIVSRDNESVGDESDLGLILHVPHCTAQTAAAT